MNDIYKKVNEWLRAHNLSPNLSYQNSGCLVDVPMKPKQGEFYLKLDYLGTKHYIDASNSDDLAEWLRLTEKLFL